MVIPVVTRARSYCPVRYRTRWSPYASGLVTGDVYYSPYANKYGQTGLVPGHVRYSPYAYSYKQSGLVVDTAWGFSGYSYTPYYDNCSYHNVTDCGSCQSSGALSHDPSDLAQEQESYQEELEARKERFERLRQSREQKNKIREKDGKEIISCYLKLKNIDFRTNRILQVENKILSVDFILEGKNIIIKYWNPVEILSLEQQPEYRMNFYKRYLETWKDFCGKYQRAGGKIYQVITADTEEILAKLILCHELNDG